jgi:hypothetical protein
MLRNQAHENDDMHRTNINECSEAAGTEVSLRMASSQNAVGVFGGAERDRTADLLVANEALSQLSYSPTGQRQ